tara:strand:- start:4829 stop:13990 length:9162 start_codon:yes stop_codon:yes gene_type:complete
MPSATETRRTPTVILLVMMFLLADLLVPQAVPEWQQLEDQSIVFSVTTTDTATYDTVISDTNPNTVGNQTESASLGISEFGEESRLLFTFPMNITSSSSIQSATLALECGTDSVSATQIHAYTASIIAWNDSEATWMQSDSNTPWGEQGADGNSDRGAWEPPFRASANGTFTLNVTAHAQQAASNNDTELNVLVSGNGALYSCEMSESQAINNRPELTIVSSTTPAGNGGSMTSTFAEDGKPLMTGDFLLTADRAPLITYDSLTGQAVEYQFSTEANFKSALDLEWHYSSLWNTFTTTATSGSYQMPSGEQFDNGSEVHYRYRSMDASGTLGNWTSESFLLPAHDVVDNGDNTATITLDVDSLGLPYDFIEDTFANQLSRNTKYGTSATMAATLTSTKESVIHFRMDLGLVGLHDNATITDADVVLQRQSSSGSTMLSMHGMDSNIWVEDQVTWNRGSNGNNWDDGGRSYSSTATATGIYGDQTASRFQFGFTNSLQSWLESPTSDAADYIILARGENGPYSTGGTISTTFHTSEASTEALQPTVEITYAWGTGATLPVMTQTAPAQGKAVWNQTGHNFSANTTPSLGWDGSVASSYDIAFQMATDEHFRDRVWDLDNMEATTSVAASAGQFNMTGTDALDAGNMYFWRMAFVDTDGRLGDWATSNFLVSSAESTWLGGDRYEFRMSHGNGTDDGLYPACMDTFIDSGTPTQNYDDESKLLVSYNPYPSEAMALMSCDLKSNLLPAGYAVESANLEFTLGSSPYNAPTVAVWENTQQNWSAEGATWSTYDGTNNWGMAGAKGSERGSLLDSVALTTNYASGDSVEWNVTLGVQNAMRENRSVNFFVGVLGVGTGQSREVQLFPGSGAVATRPELTFVYVPGSNAVPNDPSPSSPLNGSWAIGAGVDLTPLDQPTLAWNFNSNLSVGGWAVQLDTTSTFDSSNLQVSTSWNDDGFDFTNNTYTPETALDKGVTWHWRVRAISATNQIGNWSNSYHFLLPDLTTWQTCADGSCAAVELHHREAMPSLNLPNFEDTYVYEAGSGSPDAHDDDTQMKVGAIGFNRQAVSLIRIPLNAVPQPANARVTDAALNLYSEFGSSTGEPLAIRPVLQSWTGDANDTTYDGVNNWSAVGGRDIGVDAGEYVDLQTSVSADWMTWDVTEAAQAALDAGASSLSLMVYASNEITAWSGGANVITFTTSEGTSSNRPWLNLTWTNGTVAVPSTAGTNVGPANASIQWDTTSHAVLPNYAPVLSWSLPTATTAPAAWRVIIFEDADDDMAGRTVYDSRDAPSAFDLTNLTFTPPTDIEDIQTVRWTVQPIDSGMIGPQSSSTLFYIPSVVSGEVDSTHAWIDLQDGSIIESLNYPSLMADTAIDSGNTQSNNGAGGYLYVGQSPSSSTLRSSTLISVDFSTLPLPTTFEIHNATLDLSAVSGNGEVYVTVSQMITSWDESSTWAHPGNNNTSWVGVGAYHSADSQVPETDGFWMNASSEYSLNVTSLLQHAILRGASSLDIILQAEEVDGTVDGVYYIASSENTVQADRPTLSFTYETTNPWGPSTPTGLVPADGATLWNMSATRPSGADEVNINWSSIDANHTQWVMCGSPDARMIDASCFDSTTVTTSDEFNLTWDAQNLSLMGTDVDKGDEWHFWRIRGDQDHRIGSWSSINKFRIPDNQGYDDGDGNQSLALYRGSIFTDTGLLPSVPDAEISSTVSSNMGSSQTLNLGTSGSGSGQSSILMEFDLSSMPWPTAMTPTSMLLSMYRYNVVGTSATTISAHACSSFVESSVTWNNTATCTTSEITRSTLTLNPSSGWIEWDLTSLAQSNVVNGNMTMTVMLEVVGTPYTNHQFYSSDYINESFRPRIVLEYIDNVDGIQPPTQPSLTYPTDGKVLYNTSGSLLTPDASPVLSWAPSIGATGYIVTIANQSGVYKFRSWEGTSITNSTFRFPTSLDTGEVFQWWVQGVNQSIPGPSSSRWSFAIGDPTHTDNNDLTYTYQFQTGNEVTQFGHTNVRETHLSEADSDTNYGDSEMIEVGTYFGQNSGKKAYMTFALDNSQVPLPLHASIHSASLGLYLDSWIAVGGANGMTFDVHRITNTQWSQSASTWNNASTGNAWGAAGMQAGTDYDATPVSSFIETDLSDNRWIWFDISAQGMLIDNDNAWLIIGTPNRGDMMGNFISSESPETLADFRPIVLLNHTNVTTLDLTPTAPTTNADTPISFGSVSYDHLSMPISTPIVWSASNGTISSTGVFTPYATGQHTVSACFGIICATEIVTVTPGAPITLIASGSAAEITADGSMTVTAVVVDQFGNIVPNQAIAYTPSNGTMDLAQPNLFMPYAVGLQTIDVAWNGQTVSVDVLVTTGVAAYFTLEGCTGTNPAGVWCTISHTLYDQFHNEIQDVTEAGSLTWTVANGNYSTENSEYFPDHVGMWMLNLTSTSGAQGQLAITVGHGEMDRLELDLSETAITADDRIYINTTRIDVRGNRLPVFLPSQNWTKTSDGILTAGGPAIWDPISRGQKILEAKYEDQFTQVSITVEQGAIVTLVLVVENVDSVGNTFQLTADDSIDVKVKATDQKGNRWSVSANWTLSHASWTDQAILEGAEIANDEVTFQPYLSSANAYTITAIYDDSVTVHEVSLFVEVAQGDLISTTITALGADGTTGEAFDITSDEYIDFAAALEDQDTNEIDASTLTWVLIDGASGDVVDITAQLVADNMRWQATEVGNYTIAGYAVSNAGYNISDSVSITVLHGVAVSVVSEVDTFAQDAGKEISIQITGTDADGNTFPQTVEWSENSTSVSDMTAGTTEGAYAYFARTAGTHTLEFTSGQASSVLELSVAAQRTVSSITVELSTDTTDQLGSFTVTVLAFDAYENPIEVPSSTNVDSSGRAEVLAQGQGVWKVVTLDSGPQTITVTSGKVSESLEYEVLGNVGGFFKAGGPLYYVGAGLAGIIVFVILGLLVVALRGGGEDYDDEFDYEDEEDEPQRSAAGPSGPAPGPSGPAPGPSGPAPGPSGPAPTPEPAVEEDTSWIQEHRVDDDGTEWAESEDGTWFYRQPDESEWSEWTD